MAGYDAYYRRLADDSELPTTSQPSIGDFLGRLRAALDAGHESSRSTSPGGISGTARRREQARVLLASAAGERVQVIDGRTACGGLALLAARGAAARARAGDARRGPASRIAGARAAADLVRPRHARPTCAAAGGSVSAGMARRHAEDQADPLGRIRDHPGRAGAHLAARVRADGRLRAELRDNGADGWVVQHIQAPERRRTGRRAAARSSAPTRSSSRRSAR